MVKRSRSESVSSTASEDPFEPLPHAGASNGFEHDAGLPSKRRRLGDREPGPLERMPPEIRSQIISDLIDPHDLLNSLNAVERLRRTGSILNSDVAKLMHEPRGKNRSVASGRGDHAPKDFQRTNPILATAGKLLVQSKASFANLPIKNSATTREETTLQDNVFKCDLIPVAGKIEKSDLTRDILRSRNSLLKYEALDSLALNVAYLEPHDRAALVGCICTRHREFIEDDAPAGLGSAVKALIERAEYLSAVDQRHLADAAFETVDPGTKTEYLEAFAGKIDVIVMRDTQKRIVDAIVDDETEGKGYRLGLLAERLDRISASGLGETAFDSAREKTAGAILALDRLDTGRLWAMSKLVEKLDCCAPQTIRHAASAAAEELARPFVEAFDENSAPWYTEPSTSRVEMAHHLSTHTDLLMQDEADNVSAFIKDTLASPGNYRPKAQLLPHMRPRKRGRFVERCLPDDADPIAQDAELEEIARQVVEGLTLRVKDLDEGEKGTCAYYMNDVLSPDNAENALTYNISNNLRHFPLEDANNMARAAISQCKNLDLESAVGIFNHVARQAAQLDAVTVARVVSATSQITTKLSRGAEPEENAALRSLAVFAAQSVANRSREILVKGTTGLEGHLKAERSHSRRGYDDRPSDRVR